MPTQEFETEIAVKIALLEPKEIAELRRLAELASVASAKTRGGIPTALGDLLRRSLQRFTHDVLELSSVNGGIPYECQLMISGEGVRTADAATVIRCLLVFSASSTLATPNKMTPDVVDQLDQLVGRLCELVDSMHGVRESSDLGWQWNDFNAGWADGFANSEYDLALVLKALRSPAEHWLPPKDPAGSGHLSDFITYWYSLSAVVLGHLAWSNPTVGMTRWLNLGMPGDEGLLSGIKRLYGADVAALILNRNVAEAADALTEKVPDSRGLHGTAYDASKNLSCKPEIARAVDENARWAAMTNGGSDSLHLSVHLRSLLLGPSPRPIRLSGGHDAHSEPQAHLLLPDAYGWYESLQRRGDSMPSRQDGRSWRVDVTSATLGYLGEFRKSRETGRWFAGKHSSHMLGN